MYTSIRLGLPVLLVALAGVMIGCARTSTAPLDGDTVEITVRVGTICDGRDADRLARRQAAVETISRGFEDYIVIDSFGGDHLAEAAFPSARTNLDGNRTGTLFSEEAPLLAHHRVLTVRMFHAGQGDSTAAVSARAVLGDDWEGVVTRGAPTTCLGLGG